MSWNCFFLYKAHTKKITTDEPRNANHFFVLWWHSKQICSCSLQSIIQETGRLLKCTTSVIIPKSSSVRSWLLTVMLCLLSQEWTYQQRGSTGKLISYWNNLLRCLSIGNRPHLWPDFNSLGLFRGFIKLHICVFYNYTSIPLFCSGGSSELI